METILLLLIFILIPLANYVLERMRRRYEASPPDSRRAPDPGMRRQPAPPPTQSVSDRKRAPEARPVVVIQSTARPGIRRTLFRTRRDVRRTIVGMTILGPCRAYDPPDY